MAEDVILFTDSFEYVFCISVQVIVTIFGLFTPTGSVCLFLFEALLPCNNNDPVETVEPLNKDLKKKWWKSGPYKLKKKLNVMIYFAPYLTLTSRASLERGECLTWVSLTDRQPRRRTCTATDLDLQKNKNITQH